MITHIWAFPQSGSLWAAWIKSYKPILRGRNFRIVKEPDKWSENLRKMLKLREIARVFADTMVEEGFTYSYGVHIGTLKVIRSWIWDRQIMYDAALHVNSNVPRVIQNNSWSCLLADQNFHGYTEGVSKTRGLLKILRGIRWIWSWFLYEPSWIGWLLGPAKLIPQLFLLLMIVCNLFSV